MTVIPTATALFAQNAKEQTNARIGAGIIFTAPYGTAFPTGPGDVINLSGTSAFAPKTGWTAVGATKSGIKIERGFSKVDRTSDQSFGAFDSRPNNWTAMVTTEMVEISPTNLAMAWEGGAPSSTAATYQALDTAAAAGQAVISVATSTTLVAGNTISIGAGNTQEWHSVMTVAAPSMGHVLITLGENLAYAHAVGENILLPGTSAQSFGRPIVTTPRVVAVLALMSLAGNTQTGGAVTLIRATCFRFTRLQDGQKQMTISNDNDWTVPLGFIAYADRTVTDQLQDTFSIFDLTL